MGELKRVIIEVFNEIDQNPDKEITMEEILHWVAHADSVISVLRAYEPTQKVHVDASLFEGINLEKPQEEEKKAKTRAVVARRT